MPTDEQEILDILKARFDKFSHRHPNIEWSQVQARLQANPHKLYSLLEMEKSGGEPDVVAIDTHTNEIIFYDCSPETPQGRRNVCYDLPAQQAREKQGIHPQGNACGMASEMGVELLTEEQYYQLQTLGEFDTRTSSWLKTPPEIRKLGGALFGDRRYGRVFIYHNSAPSFYSVRGFRCCLRV